MRSPDCLSLNYLRALYLNDFAELSSRVQKCVGARKEVYRPSIDSYSKNQVSGALQELRYFGLCRFVFGIESRPEKEIPRDRLGAGSR